MNGYSSSAAELHWRVVNVHQLDPLSSLSNTIILIVDSGPVAKLGC